MCLLQLNTPSLPISPDTAPHRPRDAAIEIVNHINSRNPNVALLGTTVSL